jgi:hypothetical protein
MGEGWWLVFLGWRRSIECEGLKDMAKTDSSSSSPPREKLARRLLHGQPRSVFLVFLAIYLVSWGGHYTSGDGAIKVAWAKAMLFRATAAIDSELGVAYSKYGVGHSLLAIAPLVASEGIRRATGIRAEAACYTLLFVINGALFLALLAAYLGEYYAPNRVWATVAIIGLTSTWWPHTKLDYSEPLVLTFFFAAFLLLRKGRSGWGLFAAGLGSTIRQDALLLVAVLGLWQMWRTRSVRDVPHMAMALTPAAFIHAIANYARYGSVLSFGYEGESFDNPLLVGLYGILLSAGKSVFLFSPPLLLGTIAWRRFESQPGRRPDAVLFASVFVVQLLFYAKFWSWSADDSWGDRYMIPGVVLMCIPLVETLSHRALVSVVALAGLFVQLLAVSVGGLDYVMLLRSQNGFKQNYYGFTGKAALGPDDLWYQPRYSQLVGNWVLLRTLVGYPPKRQTASQNARLGLSLYETFPPESWQRAAHWDFVWVSLFQAIRDRTIAASSGRESPPAAPSRGLVSTPPEREPGRVDGDYSVATPPKE